MRVFVTGATGFLGHAVTAALLTRGDQVVALSRSGGAPPGAEAVTGDPTQPGPWQERAGACDAVVHLAGEPLAARRWNDEVKERIRRSRVDGTRQVAAAHPRLLVSMSGVDIYPFDDSDREYAEDAAAATTFLAGVCSVWESEALRAAEDGARVVVLRTGVVLGHGGGAMKRLAPVFRLFAGGPLGSGKQWLSWVHLEDVAGVVLHALDDAALQGPVNVVAGSVRQAEFARALGDVLKRPSWLPVPALALRLGVGELAEYLLHGRRVVPQALTRAGYSFRLAALADALAACL